MILGILIMMTVMIKITETTIDIKCFTIGFFNCSILEFKGIYKFNIEFY